MGFKRRTAPEQAATQQGESIERQLLATTLDGYILADNDGNIVDVNPAYCRLIGYTEAELRTMNIRSIEARLSEEQINERIQMMLSAGRARFETRHRRKDGGMLDLDVSVSVMGTRERPLVAAFVRDITDKKRAQQALRNNALLLEKAQQLAQLGIWEWQIGANVVTWSDQLYRIYGLDRDSFGASFEGYLERVHPDDREHVQETIGGALESADSFTFMERIMRPDGDVRTLRSWGGVVVDDSGKPERLFGACLDITDQVRAEHKVRASEQRYRSMFERAPVGILEGTANATIDVNPRICAMLGYSRGELLARTCEQLAHRDASASVAKVVRVALQRPRSIRALELRLRRKDGSYLWGQMTVTGVQTGDGGAETFIAVIKDITDNKRAQDALQQAHRQLEQRVAERTAQLAEAKERAESADRIKSAFLATMSHELRTPLNSILGFTGILLRGMVGELNPEQEKQLSMVMSSSRHLLELINDVLDISKIEAGEIELHPAACNIAQVVERARAMVEPLADKKQLELRVDVADDVTVVECDERRLQQVLVNLANNAVKFTDTGSVSIECDSNGELVTLRVRDTGIGIKAEHLDQVFLPFHQLDAGLARRHEGTGLGLAICKRLVGLMGGEIRVDSEWGRGTTFEVDVPIHGGGEA